MPSSKKQLRSRCPVGFEAVSVNHSQECPALEDVLSDKNSSLWLIKVPHDFDLSSLSGQNVVLNGSQDVRSSAAQDTGKRYEVQSKTDCSAQLSSFTVLLPSLQQKSLCAAGSISGQMSVIRSVSVPPPTLPESSLSVPRQPPTQVIRKWKPFGYRKPRRKSKRKGNEMTGDLSVKEKKTKEHKEIPKDGSRKHTKERKATDLEESVNSNASGKNKRDSPKKKKKDEAKHEVDLTRVKTERDADDNKQMAARNTEHSSHSPRKRKAEMNEKQPSSDDLALTTSKKKKKLSNSKSLDTIVKQEHATPDDKTPGKHQDPGKDELTSLKQKKIKSEKDLDLAQVEREPKESHRKKKHYKTKTC